MTFHKSILYSLVLALLIFQLAAYVSFKGEIDSLKDGLRKSNIMQANAIQQSQNLTLTRLDNQEAESRESFRDLSFAIIRLQEQFTNITRQQSRLALDMTALKSSQGDFSGIAQEAFPSVVGIVTEDSIGTGFVVSDEGYVVTNYHVIGDSDRLAVITYDDRILAAEYLGGDTYRDIALLRIEKGYPALKFSDNPVVAGSKVIAIGNPLGLSFTVTEGIVSGTKREGLNGLYEYIQTDVSLNPGNSGGPLIDTTGYVIGINNYKVRGAENIGFALQSYSARKVINSLANSSIV